MYLDTLKSAPEIIKFALKNKMNSTNDSKLNAVIERYQKGELRATAVALDTLVQVTGGSSEQKLIDSQLNSFRNVRAFDKGNAPKGFYTIITSVAVLAAEEEPAAGGLFTDSELRLLSYKEISLLNLQNGTWMQKIGTEQIGYENSMALFDTEGNTTVRKGYLEFAEPLLALPDERVEFNAYLEPVLTAASNRAAIKLTYFGYQIPA